MAYSVWYDEIQKHLKPLQVYLYEVDFLHIFHTQQYYFCSFQPLYQFLCLLALPCIEAHLLYQPYPILWYMRFPNSYLPLFKTLLCNTISNSRTQLPFTFIETQQLFLPSKEKGTSCYTQYTSFFEDSTVIIGRKQWCLTDSLQMI